MRCNKHGLGLQITDLSEHGAAGVRFSEPNVTDTCHCKDLYVHWCSCKGKDIGLA